MKTALITGVSGQDGGFLASQLIDRGINVIGTFRRGGNLKAGRLKALNIFNKIKLVPLEVSDMSNVLNVMDTYRPDFVYNLAAQSFVQDSFIHPTLTTQINYFGVLNILESIRLLKLDSRFFQASSSEIFGNSDLSIQNEDTPLKPLNPYAIAKCAAHMLVGSYREAYGIHASSGILFNHESELRGREFVTRKISSQIAEIAAGRVEPVELGNLDSNRDWGYARDFTRGMQIIAESDSAGDYVLATNTSVSVRDFFSACATAVGFSPSFEGGGVNEKCYDSKSGRLLCKVNESFFRPIDVNNPRGDSSKMLKTFGWKADTGIKEIAKLMVQFDQDLLRKQVNDFDV